VGKPIDDLIAKANLPNASEDAHQSAFFACLVARARVDPRLKWVFAVPNGGTRDKISAGIMVATGTRAGVWDVCLPFPSGKYPFGFIEFKREKYRTTKDGGLSDGQVQFGKHLAGNGAWFAIVYSYTEALTALELYLQGKPYYAGR
jgi:hypothetical protein